MTGNFIRDLDAKYSDDRGISAIWSNYESEGAPCSELTREFHPMYWGLGMSVRRQIADYISPHMMFVVFTAGPWTLCWRREWPGDRAEFLAWSDRREQMDAQR